MQQHVFNIQNLTCEYIPDTPVLRISELEIPRGKLIFVIGRSGIGKSTFIETLGLMNRTIALKDDVAIRFMPEAGSEEIRLQTGWSLPNQQLSNLRMKYFSFIFQNTNLMPNFTAGENMMMSLLIQGIPAKQAKKAVLRVMARLSLEPAVFDKKITALSGGQRQRLAFVRAVTTDFTVLFGDEPTGNLDENTAHELMAILKDLIREEGKTCIIVSHDLKLAERFADIVIPITIQTNDDGTSVGEIKSSNILRNTADTWANTQGDKIEHPLNYFKQFLNDEAAQ